MARVDGLPEDVFFVNLDAGRFQLSMPKIQPLIVFGDGICIGRSKNWRRFFTFLLDPKFWALILSSDKALKRKSNLKLWLNEYGGGQDKVTKNCDSIDAARILSINLDRNYTGDYIIHLAYDTRKGPKEISFSCSDYYTSINEETEELFARIQSLIMK